MPVLLRSIALRARDRRALPADRLPDRLLHRPLRGQYRNALIALLVIPFFVNYLVRTYAWVALLADEGLVNNALVDLGLPARGSR